MGLFLKYGAGIVTADFLKLHKQIAAYGASSTVERFETETDPQGKKWKQSLRAKLTGGQTLSDKGQLKSSVTEKATEAYAAWGTNKIYARIHNEGGTIKAKTSKGLFFKLAGGAGRRVQKVTMPKREFIGLSNKDERAITKIAGRFITP